MALAGRTYSPATLALLLLIAVSPDLGAQSSPFDPGLSDQAARIVERVMVYADRSLYISGESISFMARAGTEGLAGGEEWSKILYVELFSAGGSRQALGKFRIHRGAANGEIRIPDGLLSGNYYLRCYTRWMRNRDPATYAYLPLRIVNPYTAELAEQVPRGHGKVPLQGKILLQELPVNNGDLEFSKPASVAPGDTVLLDLTRREAGSNGTLLGCISVVPAAAAPGGPRQAAHAPGKREEGFHLDFLPDLNGITLSGKLVHPAREDLGIGGCRVHFTMLGSQPAYSVARTDAEGHFVLSLPRREGLVEFLVQPECPGGEAMEVRIDQDYDQRVYDPDIPDFRLNLQEREVLIQMARKLQLSRIYGESLPDLADSAAIDPLPFYGSPGFSLDMDEYVLLPTLEEVFINLVPSVTPFRRRNQPGLLINSENPALSLFPPLMMVDQVPLFDLEQFLSIPPGKISRIDVVTDVYLKGDLRFGGIINLRTREGNMAGIELPDHAFFIDYQALYPPAGKFPFPGSPGDRTPDFRNTVLWMPGVMIPGSASRTIAFTAPDYPGRYVVLFQGWDDQGDCVSAETIFVVE